MKVLGLEYEEVLTIISEKDVVSQAAMHFLFVFVSVFKTSFYFPTSSLIFLRQARPVPTQIFGLIS